MPLTPEARPPRIRTPRSETAIGRLLTPLPSFAHKPLSLLLTPPNFGTNGQNRPRPKTTSAAGKTPSAAIIAITIPVAQTRPRALLPARSANERVSSASVTVVPDAMIAGPAPRIAFAMATCLSSCKSNSSRYRAINSSA